MLKIYVDSCGTYSIKIHRDGTASLVCRNNSNNRIDHIKRYKNETGAKIALARYCGGMPKEVRNEGE